MTNDPLGFHTESFKVIITTPQGNKDYSLAVIRNDSLEVLGGRGSNIVHWTQPGKSFVDHECPIEALYPAHSL